MHTIVFTDLDGCLLDHRDYSFDAALPALAELNRRGIPLIIATSKTRAEVTPIRERLGIDHPFIVENGGAIVYPPGAHHLAEEGCVDDDGVRIELRGASYDALRRFIVAHREEYGITGFGDMTPETVAALTGLSTEEAARAQKREFSEPFSLAHERRLPDLAKLAASRGLTILRGGRFYHCVASGQDKGTAARALLERYRSALGGDLRSIAIGDAENDLPLLRAATDPVLLPRSDDVHIACDIPRLFRATQPGPRGWAEAVLALCGGR
ncbi:MAG TPA: HAD-IIB family hydrolase [Spirochaetota bacterium]|nr:HAD-IIB family hydrolase [Spirochaetota bacterium]HNT11502.1 HAD-IIB family hydrolase [Spirochaetota bacterium]